MASSAAGVASLPDAAVALAMGEGSPCEAGDPGHCFFPTRRAWSDSINRGLRIQSELMAGPPSQAGRVITRQITTKHPKPMVGITE